MKKITTWKRVATIACLISVLVACGQKGDLYLPEGNAFTSWMS